jgi:UDP-2,4-diacetamido-2,4,6-trideoxy-beta-L-altropyranose hydrolase
LNILFRCDGSIEIGMGHVVRCLALADYLKEYHSCNIHFAMRQSELGIDKVVESFPVLQTNEIDFNYKEWLIDCITQTKSETLIMDMRDGLTKEDLKLVKKRTGIKVVTIDDPEDKRLESDLAFYPPVPQLMKTNWDRFKGELYVGWEYVIVRKEFLNRYPRPNNTIPNIVVSMGGTDEKNITEFVINALNQINEQFKATIIVGAGYTYLEQLNKNLKDVQFEFELYQNPKNIAQIMSQTDFAIISFGQTAYELVALKVPALYLCLTKDHQESAQLFVKEGLGKSLGIFGKNNESIINHMQVSLNNLLKDYQFNMPNKIPFGLNNISYPIIALSD